MAGGSSLMLRAFVLCALASVCPALLPKPLQQSPAALSHGAAVGGSLEQSKASGVAFVEHQGWQAPEESPIVTHKSWFSKMGDSFNSMLLGIALMFFSIAFLWVNEARNAEQESVIYLGQSEVQSIDVKSSSADAQDSGTLVHLTGAAAQGVGSIKDQRFAHVKWDQCLRIRVTVEAYQWQEAKHSEEVKDRVGGGSTTVTSFSYDSMWSSQKIDSGSFHESSSHRNILMLPALALGKETSTNDAVQYGDHHFVPCDLVAQLDNFQDASSLVGASVYTTSGGKFDQKGDWYYYLSGRLLDSNTCQIGDMRVRFEYVPDGPATILALQTDDEKLAGCGTFLPYRLVSRGFFGYLSGKELQRSLVAEGKLSGDDLYERGACGGPLASLCCCCNLVKKLFAQLSPPQIYGMFRGQLSAQECFERLSSQAVAKKWMFRLLGWVLLYAGFMAFLHPLFVVFDIIPFLGPYFGTFVNYAVGIVAFLGTLAVATLVVSLAYMVYHPLLGLLYLLLTGAILAAPMIISHLLQSNEDFKVLA
ncbi:unnamed protein product [Polarella glacialis]|uniref:Transmembrane protein 43 n=2 Tax=Polarella glacialis TaxID=89957 RepID=A0A813JNP0_POLGL|nr:unnamed protein product [Polarella glacialis]